MTSDSLLLIAIWFIGGGILGGKLWEGKGGPYADGFLIGALFGIFGVAYCAIATPSLQSTQLRECPFCKERMRRDASVCPHCACNPNHQKGSRRLATRGGRTLRRKPGEFRAFKVLKISRQEWLTNRGASNGGVF